MKQQVSLMLGSLWVLLGLTILTSGCGKKQDETLTAAPPAPANAQPLPTQPKKNLPKLPPLQGGPAAK